MGQPSEAPMMAMQKSVMAGLEMIEPDKRPNPQELFQSIIDMFNSSQITELDGYRFPPGVLKDASQYAYEKFEPKEGDVMVASYAKTGERSSLLRCNDVSTEARRQDLAAGGAKNQKGGPHFKNTILDVCSKRGAIREMGGRALLAPPLATDLYLHTVEHKVGGQICPTQNIIRKLFCKNNCFSRITNSQLKCFRTEPQSYDAAYSGFTAP